VVRDLLPFLSDLEADFVIDHMGYMLESDGLTRSDFDRLLTVIASGRGWIKLSAPYRIAKDGNYARLQPLVAAVMDAAPRRVIWGSDWPHIPDGDKDTGELLNLLATWMPDSEALNRVLVTNPAELFRFDE
jgi:predicted TIM-barrel fold metal-dependent hydrolase